MTAVEARNEQGELIAAALSGDQSAWAVLVDRFNPKLWGVAWSHRLDEATAHDVIQIAWMRFLERGHTLRDPDALGPWLATIVRNEARRLLERQRRNSPSDYEWDTLPDDDPDDPFAVLVDGERKVAVRNAFKRLGEPCQELLQLLTVDPPLSYAEVAAVLDKPIGSIGATRQRCIARLRQLLDHSVYQDDEAGLL
jgi:RNA polymerase sigma factor (sigma-70 family)